MKKILLISITISTIITIVIFYNNSELLDYLFWKNESDIKYNIAPYVILIIVYLVPYSILANLSNFSQGNVKTDMQSERTVGVIKNIEYSSFRMNNKPYFDVTVDYNNVSKVFSPLDERIQFNFKIADNVIIHYNPHNVLDSFFDIDKSINEKGYDMKKS